MHRQIYSNDSFLKITTRLPFTFLINSNFLPRNSMYLFQAFEIFQFLITQNKEGFRVTRICEVYTRMKRKRACCRSEDRRNTDGPRLFLTSLQVSESSRPSSPREFPPSVLVLYVYRVLRSILSLSLARTRNTLRRAAGERSAAGQSTPNEKSKRIARPRRKGLSTSAVTLWLLLCCCTRMQM